MLDTIREKTQGWFATIVLLLIGIPFALWGINSYFEGGSAVNVATVEGVDITADAYRATLERQRQNMYRLMGKNADTRMLDNPAFKARVLDSMIDELLVSQHGQDYGYRIGDERLVQAIQSTPQFLNSSGKFDQKLYQEVLRTAGLTPASYERSLREDMVAEQVRGGFGQVVVTGADVDRLLRLEAQQRTVSYLVIAPEQYKSKVSVSDDQINSYYTSHADEFKVPAQVRIEYLRLSVPDLAKDVQVTEEELRKAYEDDGRFVTPEERRASHILISIPTAGKDGEQQALAKAQDLRKQIMAGADFATLARKHSEDPGSGAKGGDLGFVKRGAFVKEFETALFSMKPGEVSQPVKSQYGYHVIKLVSVKPEVRKPFAQVRGELEASVRTHKAEERFYEAGQRLQNLVYEQPESLRPAAEAMGLKTQQSEWFSRAGGAGIASEPKVVEAAFSSEVFTGQRNSDTIEIGSSLVALHVTERHEERTRALAEVRPLIVERLRQAAAEQEAARAGEALLAHVQEGRDLASEAKATGTKVVMDKIISRRKAEGIDNRLVQTVFQTARPQEKPTAGGVDLGKDGYAVFVLKKVADADPAQVEPALRQQVTQLLERRRGEELFQTYMASLRKSKSVKIHQDKL